MVNFFFNIQFASIIFTNLHCFSALFLYFQKNLHTNGENTSVALFSIEIMLQRFFFSKHHSSVYVYVYVMLRSYNGKYYFRIMSHKQSYFHTLESPTASIVYIVGIFIQFLEILQVTTCLLCASVQKLCNTLIRLLESKSYQQNVCIHLENTA